MLVIAFATGTANNKAALTGTKRGEEGLVLGLIDTSRQIGGPIALTILWTIANFAPSNRSVDTISSDNGNGRVGLGAALLTGIGIIFAAWTRKSSSNLRSAREV